MHYLCHTDIIGSHDGKLVEMDAPLRVAGFSGAARRVVHPLVYREIELYVHHRADREGECRRTAFRGYLCGRGRRYEPFRLPGLHEQDAAHSACGTQDEAFV